MPLPSPTEKQARLIWHALTGLAFAVVVALVVVLLWALGHVVQILSPVLWPLAVAGVLAYLLDPVVGFLERKGTRRPQAILAVFAGALLLIAGLFASVVPHVLNETRELALNMPAIAGRLTLSVAHWIDHPPPWVQRFLPRVPAETNAVPAANVPAENTLSPAGPADSQTNPAAVGATNAPPSWFTPTFSGKDLQAAARFVAQGIGSIAPWLWGQKQRIASWFSFLVGLALVPVYTFYFLLEKQRISSNWSEYLPVADSHFKEELVFMLGSMNDYLVAFFRGQVLVAMCDGVVYSIGFLIIGLPYAVLIGAMAVALTMIPFLGAIVTCCAALVIAVAQYGDWAHPLMVLAVSASVQTLEALVISPRIMGGRVGLHPVTIIIAVMAGTTLFGGLLGGILAIPLTAALRVAMARYIWKKSPAAKAQPV